MARIRQLLDAVWRAVQRELRFRLVWRSSARLAFTREVSDKFALLAVIGREHYRERRVRYPVSSRQDLARIVALETRGKSGVLTRIGPLVDNARSVQFFEVAESFVANPPRALFWIPESVVVAIALDEAEVATVARDNFRYYVAQSGVNQLHGGAIVSPALFRMAAGVPLEGLDREIDGVGVLPLLERGLRRLSLEDWWSFIGPEFRGIAKELWRPAAAGVAAVGLLYLLSASAYLSGALAFRQWQLDRLGPTVTPLLEAQRRVDALVAERASMRKVFDARVPAWPVWDVATEVWASGGSFTRLAFKDGELVIDGRAPSAVKVLEGLSARKDVSAARFESAVRQAGDQEQFVIRLRLNGRASGGRGS
jgi:hypothetical protein